MGKGEPRGTWVGVCGGIPRIRSTVEKVFEGMNGFGRSLRLVGLLMISDMDHFCCGVADFEVGYSTRNSARSSLVFRRLPSHQGRLLVLEVV